jgi:hypothetical protein
MDARLVKKILDDNLIDEGEFSSDPTRFKTLECFQFGLPEHPIFDRFSHITELRILE